MREVMRWTRGCLVLLLCAGAWAAERGALNEGLPRWMALGVQSRVRSEGQHGLGFQEGRAEDYVLFRNRMSLQLQPKSWLQFFGEVQDARSAGVQNPGSGVKDIFDLRQAWVGLGSEGSAWDLRVGRQKLAYGSERVIGAGEWGNTARVFDAARLALHQGGNRVDIFSASVVNNDVDQWDHHQQGNNLHGVYGSIGTLLPQAKVEPYLLYRTNHQARYHSWTSGLRTAGSAGPHWNYEAEAILQRGAVPGSDLHAWASTVQVMRHFTDTVWRPSIIGEFNFASGDKRPGDSLVGTYDQLYPTNHGIYGITDQVGRRNTRNVRSGVWFRPRKWLTMKTEGHSFWLASRYDALYSAGGAAIVAAVPGGARSTHVGNEFDVSSSISLSSHYDIGLQYGHLFAGEFLRQNTPGAGRDFYAFYLDFHM